MKAATGSRRASPLTRIVATVATMFVLLMGTSVASRAVTGDEGWWPDYGRMGFWWARSVTEFEGDLIVSGDFQVVDNQPHRWVVRRDQGAWRPMGTGLASSLGDLTVFRGRLVGIAGEGWSLSPMSLRTWSGSSWEIVPGQPGSIRAIVPMSSGVLVALAETGLWRWDGETWTTLALANNFAGPMTAWSDGVAIVRTSGEVVIARDSGVEPLGIPGGHVTLLAVMEGQLVAGSRVGPETAFGITTSRMRAWNGSSWESMGDPFERTPTHLIESAAGYEILCQHDYSGPGQTLLRWDGSQWTSTGVWFDWKVRDLEVINGRTIAAGGFWLADGRAAHGVAIDSGDGFEALAAPNAPVGGADMPVRALFAFRDRLVAGGSFITIGAHASPFLAIGDGREWTSLGEGVDGGVFALAEFNGDLIVAGDFESAGGAPAAHIARWDGSEWHAMGEGLDDRVFALASHGGRLYAGGMFRRSGSQVTEHLAAWNGNAWEPVARFDRPVLALAEFEGHLYAGGEFRRVNGGACPHLARLDGSTWTAIEGLEGVVCALTPHEGQLAVGGQMRRNKGVVIPPVMVWNGDRLNELPPRGSGFDWDFGVKAMASTTRGLVVGGKGPTASLARWDGSSWQTFGSGVDGAVFAMAEVEGSLFVAGDFLRAGGRPAERFARWDDQLVPATIEGITLERDESAVRLTWRGAGTTNLSAVEVWFGSDDAGSGPQPEAGLALLAGVAVGDVGGQYEFIDGSTRPDGVRYWLRQIGPFGTDAWSGPYELAPLPPGARIESVGPNPFFGATRVHYTLARPGFVLIEVFDPQGRRLRVLQRGDQPAGVYAIEWDGRNEAGASAAAGTYWVRLATRDGIQSRRILRLN